MIQYVAAAHVAAVGPERLHDDREKGMSHRLEMIHGLQLPLAR